MTTRVFMVNALQSDRCIDLVKYWESRVAADGYVRAPGPIDVASRRAHPDEATAWDGPGLLFGHRPVRISGVIEGGLSG